MEDVIQVLVFIVIITSVIIGKYKETHASRPQKCVQKQVSQPENEDELTDTTDIADEEEMIPTDFEDDIDQEDSEPFNIFGQFGKVHQPEEPKPVLQQAVNENPSLEPKTFTSETACTDEIRGVTHTKQPKVRIKSKREARLAFIHSEIFNRKYE